jgi:hypothetical protein
MATQNWGQASPSPGLGDDPEDSLGGAVLAPAIFVPIATLLIAAACFIVALGGELAGESAAQRQLRQTRIAAGSPATIGWGETTVLDVGMTGSAGDDRERESRTAEAVAPTLRRSIDPL